MTGNAYARIERNFRGEVIAYYPLMPISVAVERLTTGRLRYRVSDPVQGSMVLLQDEMLHVRGASRDGVLGLSPLHIARGALSLAMSQSELADGLMANSLRPSGILSYPEKVTAEAKAGVREQVESGFSGSRNAGRLMIMDGGAKFERLAMTPEDAEFLATRKLSNEDVARIFGVPPTCVGITDKATYSNTEQEARALVQNSLGPLARRVEAAMMRGLLTPEARRSLYIEHDLDSLMRGDIGARYKSYRLGREIGALSPNDIRRMENDPPIPNGDIYHQRPTGYPSAPSPPRTRSRRQPPRLSPRRGGGGSTGFLTSWYGTMWSWLTCTGGTVHVGPTCGTHMYDPGQSQERHQCSPTISTIAKRHSHVPAWNSGPR